MIRLKKCNHVGIVVKDLEKSKWFYGELFGAKTVSRTPSPTPGHWFQLGTGILLHLMVFDETTPDTMRHIALEVEDFNETYEALKAGGVRIKEGPEKRPDGSEFLFCCDPDGNLVEIMETPVS